jgi:hypothetical protein
MAYTGYEATLSGSVTGALTKVVSITWSGADSEIITLKTLADTNRWVSKIAGSRDAGELTINCEYDKTQYATLIGEVGDVAETWTATLPDNTTIVCSGIVKGVGGLEINTEGAIVYSLTIPLSGEPAVTAG